MKISRFEDIEAWQLARQLTNDIYLASNAGNFKHDQELKDQIRRAAGSAMHNIAEGFDGGSNAEFVKFLRYAQRSCTEVQSQLYLALDQSYLNQTTFERLYAASTLTKRKIGAFIRYLQTAPPRQTGKLS